MSYPNLSYSGYQGGQPPSGYPGGQPGQGYPQGQPTQGYPPGGYPGGVQQGYPGQNPYGQPMPQHGGYQPPPTQGMGGYPGGYPGGHPGAQPGSHPGGQPGSHPGGQPGVHPGGQPGSHPGGQPGVSPEVQQWFSTVDRDRSGKISAKELQAALVNGQGKNFSDTACSLMIGLFDHDKSGTIDVNEFQQLYNYINEWLSAFRTYDRDQSGHIEENELSQALQQMGFRFSAEFIKFLVARSDLHSHKQVSVDQFIVMCVQLQKFTEAFRSHDKEMKGIISISFEDFLSVALSCSV